MLDLANVPVPISEEYLAKIVDELVQNALKFSTAGHQGAGGFARAAATWS